MKCLGFNESLKEFKEMNSILTVWKGLDGILLLETLRTAVLDFGAKHYLPLTVELGVISFHCLSQSSVAVMTLRLRGGTE